MRPLSDLDNLVKSRQIDSDIERFLAQGGQIKKFTNNAVLEKAVKTLRANGKKLIKAETMYKILQTVELGELKAELKKQGLKLHKSGKYWRLLPAFSIKD